MELEELKKYWEQYDKKLNENLKLNETLLRKTDLERAKSEMDTPKNYELSSVVILAAFSLFVISATINNSADTKMLLSGTLTSAWTLLMLVLTISKVKSLTNLDFYNQSVVELQNQLAVVKRKYLNYKRMELYSFPAFIIVAIPIMAMALKGVDLFKFPKRFFAVVSLALVIGYPIAFWIYKNWYSKKLKNVFEILEEVKNFKTE